MQGVNSIQKLYVDDIKSEQQNFEMKECVFDTATELYLTNEDDLEDKLGRDLINSRSKADMSGVLSMDKSGDLEPNENGKLQRPGSAVSYSKKGSKVSSRPASGTSNGKVFSRPTSGNSKILSRPTSGISKVLSGDASKASKVLSRPDSALKSE